MLKRLANLVILAATLISLSPTIPAAALDDDQRQVYDRGIFHYDLKEGCDSDQNKGDASLVGGDNVQKAFNYLVDKGLTPQQASGILGNLLAESGGKDLPTNIAQNGGPTETMPATGGYGIAQWTDKGRQQGLIDLAAKEGKPISDLGVQLNYLWQELNTNYAPALADLRKQNTPGDAAYSFMVNFEGPADHAAGGENDQKRRKLAEDIFAKYGGGTGGAGATGGACPTSSAGCTKGKEILPVPPGGKGVAICYHAQAEMSSPDGYDWHSCGCGPTSIYSIKTSFEDNDGQPTQPILDGLKKTNAFLGGYCATNMKYDADYLVNDFHYDLKVIDDTDTRPMTPVNQQQVQQMAEYISQGYVIIVSVTSIDAKDPPGFPLNGDMGHVAVVHATDAQGNFYVANSGYIPDSRPVQSRTVVSPARLQSWVGAAYALKGGSGGSTSGGATQTLDGPGSDNGKTSLTSPIRQ